jgi:hypothetical protein
MVFNFALRTSSAFCAYIHVTLVTGIDVRSVYLQTTTLTGETMKKTMWTFAALLAVAAIPLYLVSRKRTVVPVVGEGQDNLDWDKQPWE